MPSDKCNSIMAKATGLIFHCSTSERCLLAYCSTYNAFFMDLPVSSFVSHSSLLTVKGVDLAVACNGSLPFVTEIVWIFHTGYFDCRDTFRTVLDS